MHEILKKFNEYCREIIDVNAIDFSVMTFKDEQEKDDFILKHFSGLIDIILEHIPEYSRQGDQHLVVQLKLTAYQQLEDYKQRIYRSLREKI